MSPASYLTAPPRGAGTSIATETAPPRPPDRPDTRCYHRPDAADRRLGRSRALGCRLDDRRGPGDPARPRSLARPGPGAALARRRARGLLRARRAPFRADGRTGRAERRASAAPRP